MTDLRNQIAAPGNVQELLVSEVKQAIRDSGTRQAWIAERLGITPKHMSQLMHGKVGMTADWAAKILRLCGMRLTLTVDGPLPKPLAEAIECVLLDHHTELDGDSVDANLAELAYVYQQLTGWKTEEEFSQDQAAPARGASEIRDQIAAVLGQRLPCLKCSRTVACRCYVKDAPPYHERQADAVMAVVQTKLDRLSRMLQPRMPRELHQRPVPAAHRRRGRTATLQEQRAASVRVTPNRRDQLIDAACRVLVLVVLGLTVLAMWTLKVSV